jgi:hypothetical protein
MQYDLPMGYAGYGMEATSSLSAEARRAPSSTGGYRRRGTAATGTESFRSSYTQPSTGITTTATGTSLAQAFALNPGIAAAMDTAALDSAMPYRGEYAEEQGWDTSATTAEIAAAKEEIRNRQLGHEGSVLDGTTIMIEQERAAAAEAKAIRDAEIAATNQRNKLMGWGVAIALTGAVFYLIRTKKI